MSEIDDMPNPQDEPDDEMLDLDLDQDLGDEVGSDTAELGYGHTEPEDAVSGDVDIDSDEGDPEDTDSDEVSDETVDWGSEDLEAAYLKAMSALDASDLELPPVEQPVKAARAPRRDHEDERHESGHAATSTESEPVAGGAPAPVLEDLVEPIADLMPPLPAKSSSPASTQPAEARVTPRQIIEACLFVGGPALNSKKLVGVLRGEFDNEFADREIDALNRQYAAEGRPYEIRLGEGGYRMALRDEYERIRHKVYGLGPKEVRLSQEALEVLAVVAYHQPIKQAQVEALGKPGCGAVLRQLLRRELLAVERDPAAPRDVSYKTTARFLSLFGIRSLDDLPRHEQVSYK